MKHLLLGAMFLLGLGGISLSAQSKVPSNTQGNSIQSQGLHSKTAAGIGEAVQEAPAPNTQGGVSSSTAGELGGVSSQTGNLPVTTSETKLETQASLPPKKE